MIYRVNLRSRALGVHNRCVTLHTFCRRKCTLFEIQAPIMLQKMYVPSGQNYVPMPIQNSHNCLRILIKSCIRMYAEINNRNGKLCDQCMRGQRQNCAKCTRILIKVVGPMWGQNCNIVRTKFANLSKMHRDSHQTSNAKIKTQESIIKIAQGFSWRYTRKVRPARHFSKK